MLRVKSTWVRIQISLECRVTLTLHIQDDGVTNNVNTIDAITLIRLAVIIDCCRDRQRRGRSNLLPFSKPFHGRSRVSIGHRATQDEVGVQGVRAGWCGDCYSLSRICGKKKNNLVIIDLNTNGYEGQQYGWHIAINVYRMLQKTRLLFLVA